jgi:hypothetical protein
MEWNLSSIALVLVGGSITVAGIILAAILLKAPIGNAPFLLLVTIFLVIMGIIVIIMENHEEDLQSQGDNP